MIYLDNAATTPISPEVRQAMAPYWEEGYGNPSSTHQVGRKARLAVDHARRTIARWLACDAKDLVFTSGGTEANGSALIGAYLARRETRAHIVTSAVEHHAVLHTLDFLQSVGAEVTVVPVDGDGRVQVQDVLDAVRDDTAIVSIMSVNNELGTLMPIEEIAAAVKSVDASIIVHSDMVQRLPFVAHPLQDTLVDLASFSAHKIHGPKGMGALFVRKDTPWKPIMHGGQQENRRRGGTENVAGIVGFGEAIATLADGFERKTAKLRELHETFWRELQAGSKVVRLSPEDSAPTILNVAFPGVRNDTLLMRLDLDGVAASAGSACTAGSIEPSHVLEAAGHSAYVNEAVRFSFGDQNTLSDIRRAASIVCKNVNALRI
jgi:cysteine desulfurase